MRTRRVVATPTERAVHAALHTAAADDFVEYCDAFFRSTVLTENCSSFQGSTAPPSAISAADQSVAAPLAPAGRGTRSRSRCAP